MTNKPNSGTVSVSRELLEITADFVESHTEAFAKLNHGKRSEGFDTLAAQLRALLAQPADQQGEPVAWMAFNANGYPEKCLPNDKFGFPVYLHAQPATAKVDERAEFEKFASGIGRDVGRYDDGEYGCIDTSADLVVWQARAKLNGGQS